MSGFFQEKYTLCYRKNNYSNTWNCEFGFDSITDINARSHDILKNNKDVVTTFFPVYNFTPEFIQKQKIKYNLTPIIQ